jgi:N-acetylglucosaminyl-diphospho-decaprenol L-rhamnosyltransferase
MSPSTLDIVVVSHNTAADLDACLASVVTHPPSGPYRIVVVDNASTDDSVARVRSRHPAVDVMALERNVGFAAANNVAIRASSADLVLLLNSDTVVRPGSLDTLMARHQATGAAATGPRLVDAEGRPEVSFGSMLSPWTELRQAWRVRRAGRTSPAARRATERLLSSERTVDWVSGACLLVTRIAAVEAGLLDERYFMYEEDVDFCAALRQRGGTIVYTPAAEVVHLRGRSTAGQRHSTHYDRSHLAFYQKHRPAWASILRFWLQLRGRTVR